MLGGSAHRRILQLRVDPISVVVLDVFSQETLEVLLVQDDHVIEQLPASTPNPSLGYPILPRASECRPPRFDSNMLERFGDPV